jgi:tetratricopeptide (TPR) repeat protein
LEDIQQLIVQGKYFEAFDLLKIKLSEENISPQERILALILKGVANSRLGIFEERKCRFEDSIAYLDDAIKESKKHNELILLLDAYNIQIQSLYHFANIKDLTKIYKLFIELYDENRSKLRKEYPQAEVFKLLLDGCYNYLTAYEDLSTEDNYYNKAFSSTQEAFNKANEYENKELILLLTYIHYDYIKTMHLDQLLEIFLKGIEIAEEIKNNFWKTELQFYMGRIYLNRGDFEQHLEITKQVMQQDEQNGNKYCKFKRYWSLGTHYTELFDDPTALEYYLKAIELIEEPNNTGVVRSCYRLAGLAYERMGQLDKALEYYQKTQKLYKKVASPEKSWAQSNIATIYVKKGELDKGLALQEDLLGFYTNQVEDKHQQIVLLNFLKDIYWYKDDLKKAISYTQKSLQISDEIGRKDVSMILYDLIRLTNEAGQNDLANEYLEKRKTLTKELNIKPREVENIFLDAFLLKESSNSRDWVRAELLFEQLLAEDLHYFLKVDVLINLCELLMAEALTFNDLTALQKAEKYLKELHTHAVANEIPYLTAESLWLQSKFALLNLDVEKAQLLINGALKLATDNGLERLRKKLLEELKGINSVMSQLIKVGKNTIPLSDRMNVIGFQDTIKEMKKQRILSNIEEEPIITRKLFSLKI